MLVSLEQMTIEIATIILHLRKVKKKRETTYFFGGETRLKKNIFPICIIKYVVYFVWNKKN